VYVRKQAKTYGTCRLAEGAEIDAGALCIVEDVVTSAGAILDAASSYGLAGPTRSRDLRDRRESAGARGLAAVDLELFALYTMSSSAQRLQRELDLASRKDRAGRRELILRRSGVRAGVDSRRTRRSGLRDAASLSAVVARLHEL